jgi:hypothetical protein
MSQYWASVEWYCQERLRSLRKACPSATFSTANLRHLHSEKAVTNHLCYGTFDSLPQKCLTRKLPYHMNIWLIPIGLQNLQSDISWRAIEPFSGAGTPLYLIWKVSYILCKKTGLSVGNGNQVGLNSNCDSSYPWWSSGYRVFHWTRGSLVQTWPRTVDFWRW